MEAQADDAEGWRKWNFFYLGIRGGSVSEMGMQPGVGARRMSSLGGCRVLCHSVSWTYGPAAQMGKWRRWALTLRRKARPCPDPTSFLSACLIKLCLLVGPPHSHQVSPHGPGSPAPGVLGTEMVPCVSWLQLGQVLGPPPLPLSESQRSMGVPPGRGWDREHGHSGATLLSPQVSPSTPGFMSLRLQDQSSFLWPVPSPETPSLGQPSSLQALNCLLPLPSPSLSPHVLLLFPVDLGLAPLGSGAGLPSSLPCSSFLYSEATGGLFLKGHT